MAITYKNISKHVLQLRRIRVHPGGTFLVEEAVEADTKTTKELFLKDALAAQDFEKKKMVSRVENTKKITEVVTPEIKQDQKEVAATQRGTSKQKKK